MASSTTNTTTSTVDRRPHRGWMITINNPKIPCDLYLNQWLSDGNIVFGTGQTEAGEKGTKHHQMYVVTKANPSNKNGFSLKWMKENIHTSAHFEGRRGTHEQAVEYCNKEETRLEGPWTVGEWSDTAGPSAGGQKGGGVNASKIHAVKRKIDEGVSEEQLYEEHFSEMLRYGKNFDRYKIVKNSLRRHWMTKALVLWGPPGTGKSHRAQKVAEFHFGDSVFNWDLGGGDRHFMDGYHGQKCVIINEFYGQLPINFLLKLLDRYPMQVETKGSAVPFNAELVIFTSNEHPRMWYGKGAEPGQPSKIPIDVLNALQRRFSGTNGSVIEMKDLVELDKDEPTFDDIVQEMIRVAEQPTPPPSRPASIDLTSDDAEQVECTCEHDTGYLCEDCIQQFEEDARQEEEYKSPTSPPLSQAQKLRRTDVESREWVLKTPETREGVYKPTGPKPVQSRLSFAPSPSSARRLVKAENDDDDDVDDK